MERKEVIVFSESEQNAINEIYFDAAASACGKSRAQELIDGYTFDENNKIIATGDHDEDFYEMYNEVCEPIAEINFHNGLEDDVADAAFSIWETASNCPNSFEEEMKLFTEAGALDAFGDKLQKLVAITCYEGW